MSASTDCVLLDVQDAIALLALNRPAVLNALDESTYLALDAALADLEVRSDVRAVIVTGQGSGRSVPAPTSGTCERWKGPRQEFILLTYRVTNRLAYFPRPTIAAVRGYALGGGFELVMACDLRVAGADAQFGLPEITLGSVPGSGGVQRLPLLVGPTRAKELILTGRRLPAAEALAWGLVNQVVAPAEVLPVALKMARTVAGHNPVAVESAKLALQVGRLSDWGLEPRYHSLTSWVCQQTSHYREQTVRFETSDEGP